MKRILSIAFLALVIPQITLAAWWNPASWFNNWSFFSSKTESVKETKVVEGLENRIKELEKRLETNASKEIPKPVVPTSTPAQSTPLIEKQAPPIHNLIPKSPEGNPFICNGNNYKNNCPVGKRLFCTTEGAACYTDTEFSNIRYCNGKGYLGCEMVGLRSVCPAIGKAYCEDPKQVSNSQVSTSKIQSDFSWLERQITEIQRKNQEAIKKMDDDYAATVIPAREEVQKYNDILLAEQTALRRQIEEIEKNPQGKLAGAVQAEVNDAQRESLRKQADIALQRMTAISNLQNANESFSARNGLGVSRTINQKIVSPFGETYNVYSDGSGSITVWSLGNAPKTYNVECSSYGTCTIRQLY